jgi:hypothetical protein
VLEVRGSITERRSGIVWVESIVVHVPWKCSRHRAVVAVRSDGLRAEDRTWAV